MEAVVKLHQVHHVSPPQDTPPTTLPFTFFDVLWLRFPPVERLFFYPLPDHGDACSSFFDSILPSLKHSLSLTLHHFPTLAGTITWPPNSPLPLITYVPGDTLPLTVTESNASFQTLTSNLRPAPRLCPYVPTLTFSHQQASVMALQLTLFPNQGFSLGITAHHAVLDGKSSTLFLKAWAHLCSHSRNLQDPPPLPKNLTPSFDRSTIRDPSGIGEAYANSWLNYGGEQNNRSLKPWGSLGGEDQNDVVKGFFELRPLDIEKLKKLAEAKVVVGKKVKVTSFLVTCGYVLSCLVKVDPPKGERGAFVFTVDCRGRLEGGVPETYFGNCVVPRLMAVEKSEYTGEEAFAKGVEGVSEVLRGLESGVLKDAENWMGKIQAVIGDRLYSIAGSPRFEVYGIDFGFGRPTKVDVTSIDKTGAFSLSESRDHAGGIEIGLALTNPQMDQFSRLFHQGLQSLLQ